MFSFALKVATVTSTEAQGQLQLPESFWVEELKELGKGAQGNQGGKRVAGNYREDNPLILSLNSPNLQLTLEPCPLQA